MTPYNFGKNFSWYRLAFEFSQSLIFFEYFARFRFSIAFNLVRKKSDFWLPVELPVVLPVELLVGFAVGLVGVVSGHFISVSEPFTGLVERDSLSLRLEMSHIWWVIKMSQRWWLIVTYHIFKSSFRLRFLLMTSRILLSNFLSQKLSFSKTSKTTSFLPRIRLYFWKTCQKWWFYKF